MATPGIHTLQEIHSQPEAWTAVLEAVRPRTPSWQAFLGRQPAGLTLCFGCGSTYYLGAIVASVWQTLTGQPARGVPASEIFLFPDTWLPADTPIRGLALSRSGTTTETLWAADHLVHQYEAQLACVTCYPGTPLAERAGFSLISPQGHEQSLAQTRSFSSMLVGAMALAGLVGPQAGFLEQLASLPPAGTRLMARFKSLAQRLGEDQSLTRVFFLGSGPRYGLANEAMLKLKEMSLTPAEAYHFLEFRHGPKAMVDTQTLVVGLLSDSAREAEVAVLREMQGLGGRVLALARSDEGLNWADFVVPFETNLPELAYLPLYLPILQLFGCYRALSKGLDPDSPRNLSAVIYL